MDNSRRPKQEDPLMSRIIAVGASLFFSVPTAVLIWLAINRELAAWGGFIGTPYLLLGIGIFALVAFIIPHLFPSILAAIWRGLLTILKWWG
jgi:hypothetical protein